MDIGSPKFMFVALLAIVLLTLFPLIYLFFDFFVANWLLLFVVIIGIIAFSFFLKYIIGKGGSGEAKAFHNIP